MGQPADSICCGSLVGLGDLEDLADLAEEVVEDLDSAQLGPLKQIRHGYAMLEAGMSSFAMSRGNGAHP
jgi:hypothetical protein